MAEPILWVNKARRKVTIRVDNEEREERFPQRGHTGSSDYDKPTEATFKRWERYIKACGTDARVPVTNAAAHLDDQSEYGRMIRAKAKTLGWIPVGLCPCAMIMTGALNARLVVDPDVRKGKPCQPGSYAIDKPCPHLVAEQKARRAAHAIREQKRAIALKGDVEKLLEGQQEQTKQLVDAVSTAIAQAAKKA
jgi:hypothetical protein